MSSSCFAFIVSVNFGGSFFKWNFRRSFRNDKNLIEWAVTHRDIAVDHVDITIIDTVIEQLMTSIKIRTDDVELVVRKQIAQLKRICLANLRFYADFIDVVAEGEENFLPPPPCVASTCVK